MVLGSSGAVDARLPNHVDAIQATGCYEITGLVDPNFSRRVIAAEKVPGSQIVESLSTLTRRKDEVIVIATPAELHASSIITALEREPRLIVVEKPMTDSLKSAKAIVNAVEEAKVSLRVNFHRRFDPRHRHWHSRRPPKPRLIEMRYGKGLLNYCSHMVDWLLDWYGEIDSVRTLPLRVDAGADPSPSFVCYMASGFEAVVLGVAGLHYDQFEIDILAHDERLTLTNGGTEIRRQTPQMAKYYAGYAHLAPEVGATDTAPVGGFLELYRAVAAFCLTGTPLPGCDHRAGLLNVAVLEAVRLSRSRAGESIRPRDLLKRSHSDVKDT